MNKIILVLTGIIVSHATFAAEKADEKKIDVAHNIELLKKYKASRLPQGKWEGREGKNSKCSMTVEWLGTDQDPVLKITDWSIYLPSKQNDPTYNGHTRVTILTSTDDLYSYKESMDEDDFEINLTSSKTLEYDPKTEYEVKEIRGITFVRAEGTGEISGYTIVDMQVDYESDPHDNNKSCWNLKKVQ